MLKSCSKGHVTGKVMIYKLVTSLQELAPSGESVRPHISLWWSAGNLYNHELFSILFSCESAKRMIAANPLAWSQLDLQKINLKGSGRLRLSEGQGWQRGMMHLL